MSALTKYWFLEGFNMFHKLGRPTMMQLCTMLEMENIDKGQTIGIGTRDHHNVFFLKQGTVKIMDTSNDNAKYLVKKGNLFGELSLYDEKSNCKEYAVALEDSIVCYIEAELMEELMNKHRSLKNAVLKVYGLRINRLERRLQDLLYKDSTTRISEFISAYITEFGRVHEGRIVAKNLLSHKDIAYLTNTSRQTVSNILSSLRKERVINYDSKTISQPILVQ